MGNFLLLSDNAADSGLLSGGSWAPALPLGNLQDPRPTKRGRSVGLTLAATQFRITLNTVRTFKALAIGPTNFSSSVLYRIRAYEDAGYTSELYDSGWMDVGLPAQPSLDLEWEDPNFWTGIVGADESDPTLITLIHVFEGGDVSGKYWLFEFDDQTNSDGFVEIGRLFMGRGWQASINYSPSGNSFGYRPMTTMRQALGGTRYYSDRPSARELQVQFEYLPSQEVWNEVDRLMRVTGLAKQVFVIPDPEDTLNRNKRSFLGNLSELSSFQQLSVQLGSGMAISTGIKITEAL